MDRALPRPLVIPWFVRHAAFVGLVIIAGLVNIALLVGTIPFYTDRIGLVMPLPMDWAVWERTWDAFTAGTLYDTPAGELPFIYSPLLAPIMALVPIMGFWAWAALHAAALLLLRDWRLIGLALVSAPFWTDVAGANTFTFAVVAGALALRGSRWGAVAYIALVLLAPRPVQLPLLAWLLWQRPELRWPFVGLVALNAVAVLAMGYAFEWIAAALRYGTDPAWNISPTTVLGMWWMLIGVPLAGWLAWKGRVGLAGLALSPYVVTQYLLVLLWELLGHRGSEAYRKGFLGDRHL